MAKKLGEDMVGNLVLALREVKEGRTLKRTDPAFQDLLAVVEGSADFNDIWHPLRDEGVTAEDSLERVLEEKGVVFVDRVLGYLTDKPREARREGGAR